MGAPEPDTFEVQARDGTRLAASRYAAEPVQGPTTLVLPAMGVPRRFYDPFARHLATRGHRVLSIDYRGIGGSAPGRLRGYEATLADWPRLDVAGLVDHALEAHDPDRLVVAGHSVAGQFLGLVPNKDALERFFTVASVKGYWRQWRGRQAVSLWTLAHVAVPLTARLLGYLPSRWMGLGGEDLPAGVALEWARWIRHEDYVVDGDGDHPREAFASYEGSIRALSFADDWYAPARAVRALLEMYPNAETEHRRIDPREAGFDAIGHFGFFRPRRRPLWDDAAAWLEGQAEG